MTVSRDMRSRAGKLILILVLGMTSWLAVEILIRREPLEYQEIGLIVADGRLIPERIQLSWSRPARLHLANVSGTPQVTVVMNAEQPLDILVEAGKVAEVELTRSQLRRLDGTKFTVRNAPGQTVLSVLPGELSGAVQVSQGNVAVVMTHTCAAPKSITLKKGVPVRLWVTKTPSEVGFDQFTCDSLDIRIRVSDGQLATVELEPKEVGEHLFTGTVTPDSRVLVHVVD